MLTYLYSGAGACLLSGYLLMGWMGWEPTTSGQQVVPSSVRQSPGGFRSFHFWHSGYAGGK